MLQSMKLTVSPKWEEIEKARAKSTEFLKVHGLEDETVYTVTMVISELIENSIKYGTFDSPESKITICIEIGPQLLTVEVINPVNETSEYHLNRLDKTIQWIRGHQDPFEAYIERVKPVFKEYTANLLYDLNVYKSFFDELDAEYSSEPKHVRSYIQKTIIETEGRKFMRFLDNKLEELEQIVSGFTREEHECHGFYFRKQLWNIICCSPIMKRTNLKPRGYAGDSEMMRMIYLNQYQGESTFSKLMHKHPLEAVAAQAVRQRRKVIAQKLREMQNAPVTSSSQKLKALSVASGPAFELRDILSSPQDCGKYHFALLDQDSAALQEAALLVNRLERELGAKVSVDYLNASVRTVLARRELLKEWGQFDFVYSMGLFDYLTPPVATAVLTRLYSLVKPGGWMLVGNFHVSNPSKYYMAYWNDWVIYHRTEEEFLDLLKKIPSVQAYISFEETGSQMFLHVKKPARG
ncbi:MAG: ATP-binding protein [Deltaproteobacteria bacterium]|nr:ATP-binding protein [Deltaproteobacteria bacterium]MBW1978146.1 ATP-binding protein [Deltaproteobacteria bacterium]MBW2300283.1 ATP-binding protein [Deltaproteobacteria bacterium]